MPYGTSWWNGKQQHYTDEITSSYVNNGLLNIVPIIKNKNIKILIVGNGNYKKDIETYKKIYRNNIIISGFVDIKKISEYYSISDLFVLLSTYDPSPKTLNEALNFGHACMQLQLWKVRG